jgi:hypothetical protein
MHNCLEFRERITEHILDREDVAKVGLQDELLVCSSCSDFYAQSQEMMQALDSIELSISEAQWRNIEQRLNARILSAPNLAVRAPLHVGSRGPHVATRARLTPVRTWGMWFAAAAALLLSIGLSRLPLPVAGVHSTEETPPAVYAENPVPLDPVTIDFLEQSELLLRNVMKIEPADVDDLAEAKQVAREQLAEVQQRKEAAADVPPVVNVINTYETILRDIRNVDDKAADEDINDIQKRIQQNGLIANMKAFQPRMTEVNFRLR